MSVTYITAHGSAGSLTHWTRPGIEPVSSRILVGFVTTEPQWELHTPSFLWVEAVTLFRELFILGIFYDLKSFNVRRWIIQFLAALPSSLEPTQVPIFLPDLILGGKSLDLESYWVLTPPLLTISLDEPWHKLLYLFELLIAVKTRMLMLPSWVCWEK